jgi:hypothetical protein
LVIITPALLTRMSIRPKRARVAATSSSTDARFETSAWMATAVPPAAVIPATTAARSHQ